MLAFQKMILNNFELLKNSRKLELSNLNNGVKIYFRWCFENKKLKEKISKNASDKQFSNN